MKKLKILSLVTLAIISVAISACSNDDGVDGDRPEGVGSSALSEGKYASSAAKYQITSPGSPISSIELTESGYYIIIPRNWYAPQRHDTKAPRLLSNSSRQESQQVNGTFVKISDTEYILEGYGSITIEGTNTDAISIVIAKPGEEPYTLEGTKADQINFNSPITKSLCRTWDIDKVRLKFVIEGKVIYDKTTPASQRVSNYTDLYRALEKYLKSQDDEYESDEYDYEDFMEGVINVDKVTFTRSGTYMFSAPDSEILAISMWTWKDEAKGTIRYTHIFDGWDNDDFAGDVSVYFEDNKMNLYQHTNLFDEEEDDDGEITSTWVMGYFESTDYCHAYE